MDKQERGKNGNENRLFAALGAPTEPKVAGGAFSAAAIFTPILSLIFSVFVLAAVGAVDVENPPDWYLYANFLLPQISFAAVLLVCLLWTKTPFTAAIKKQTSCRPVWFFVAILLQAGLLCLSQLNGWFLKLLGNFGYQETEILLPSVQGGGLIGVLLAVAVLPAIFEEAFFRGVLLRGVKSFGEVGGALLCGALFSLYHQNPSQTVYQFVCGTAFAWVAIRSGSILPTVLAHFLNNALIIFDYKFQFLAGADLPILIVSILCAVASVLFFVLEKIFSDRKKRVKENTADAAWESAPPKKKEKKKQFFLTAAIGVFLCALVWILNFVSGL